MAIICIVVLTITDLHVIFILPLAISSILLLIVAAIHICEKQPSELDINTAKMLAMIPCAGQLYLGRYAAALVMSIVFTVGSIPISMILNNMFTNSSEDVFIVYFYYELIIYLTLYFINAIDVDRITYEMDMDYSKLAMRDVDVGNPKQVIRILSLTCAVLFTIVTEWGYSQGLIADISRIILDVISIASAVIALILLLKNMEKPSYNMFSLSGQKDRFHRRCIGISFAITAIVGFTMIMGVSIGLDLDRSSIILPSVVLGISIFLIVETDVEEKKDDSFSLKEYKKDLRKKSVIRLSICLIIITAIELVTLLIVLNM